MSAAGLGLSLPSSSLFLLLLPPLLLAAAFPHHAAYDAYGHGIGAEVLPPRMLEDGRAVSIQVSGTKVATDAAGAGGADQRFVFEMNYHDGGDAASAVKKEVRDVTYEIRASKGGVVLFDETFEGDGGVVTIDLVDSGGAAGGEVVVVEKRGSGPFGFLLEMAGAGRADTARVTGPYFGHGGLYQFEIKVHTVGGYSDRLDPPLEWEAGVSLEDTVEYEVDAGAFGLQPMRHISYYDRIDGFEYDPDVRRITFEMPFKPDLDAINQTSVVHQEVLVPKELGDLMVTEIAVAVNGVRMPPAAVQIDDFTADARIIHVTLGRSMVLEMYEAGRLDGGVMRFVLEPGGPELPYSAITKNGQFRVIMETVPRDARSGQELEVRYQLVDVFIKNRPANTGYEMSVVQGSKELFSGGGVSSAEVGAFDSARFMVPDGVSGIIHARFENLAENTAAFAGLPIVVDRHAGGLAGAGAGGAAAVPDWVRINAGLWADGLVTDGEFVEAAGYLIKRGVLGVSMQQGASESTGGGGDGVTGEVWDNVGLWADGLVTDGEFVEAVESLVGAGAGGTIRGGG